MKIKEGISLDVLLNYGFEKINKGLEDELGYHSRFDFRYEIGHARRGQFYYLLVSEIGRTIVILATDPDGSGGIVNCPDVLIKLFAEGIVGAE